MSYTPRNSLAIEALSSQNTLGHLLPDQKTEAKVEEQWEDEGKWLLEVVQILRDILDLGVGFVVIITASCEDSEDYTPKSINSL